MIRHRLIALHQRRAQLCAKAQSEREQLSAQLARADAALAWLARGREALAGAGRHPLLVAAAAIVVLLVLRPRRALKLLAGGWSLWRLYGRAQRLWSRIGPLVQAGAERRA